jgi:hypothetical protein
MKVRKTFLFIFAAALLCSGAAPSFDSSLYRYLAPIEVTGSGYVFFTIPPVIYDKANPNLSDLRISEGLAEIPYVIWSNTRKSERKKIETNILNTSYIPRSYTTFTLDVGDTGVVTNDVTVTTSSADFVRRVTVEGSPDNKKFAVLKNNDYIFDLTSNRNLKNLTISYPATDYRYLKVTIWDDGEEPLIEVGGEIFFLEDIKGESETIPSTMTIEEKKTDKPVTELTFDLSSKNVPSSTVTLSLADTNFKRDLTLLSSNVDKPEEYKEISRTSIYSIQTQRFSRSNTTIEYPETQARYLKIIIENENNAPLTIFGATVSGVPRKVTFSADPGISSTYTLYVGNPRIESPSYDIAQVFPYIDRDSFIPVSLGTVVENTGYMPGSDLPMSERYPWILWGAIGLMILVFGAIIIRMMMRLAKEPKP